MIGQVTPLGMVKSGWRFYILFVVSIHQIAIIASLLPLRIYTYIL